MTRQSAASVSTDLWLDVSHSTTGYRPHGRSGQSRPCQISDIFRPNSLPRTRSGVTTPFVRTLAKLAASLHTAKDIEEQCGFDMDKLAAIAAQISPKVTGFET